MTILESVKVDILKIMKELNLNEEGLDFNVSFIEEASSKFGDIFTNVSLILAKKANKNPIDLAEELSEGLGDES
ncbi:MAG: Arginyl tRNA synthetase terminal domain, partial [Candidatus Parcubacteria bacterium]